MLERGILVENIDAVVDAQGYDHVKLHRHRDVDPADKDRFIREMQAFHRWGGRLGASPASRSVARSESI